MVAQFSTGILAHFSISIYKENLIDDISLEYMLTKRDNMYLKVFRHTGYESILEGEITETGVGFVIRKKLSRLGDLFKPMRPKTKKPRK